MRDRYACYQETRAAVSNAIVIRQGAAANAQVVPSCDALAACLAARGYYRSDTSNLADFNQPGSLRVPPGTVIRCNV